MVRKINKKEKKKKPVMKFMPTTEQIDQYVSEFIEYLRNICPEETVNKFTCFTKDNSNVEFMQKAMILVRIFKRPDIPRDEEFDRDIVINIKELIADYEKDYIPKMSTIVYLNLFALNKLISRYFKFNLYRKRFSKNNTNELYKSDTYKFISNMLNTKPIQADKERVFTGVWIEKSLELSKKLDKLLHRLDKYRETYIIPESIINEFDRVKNSLDYEYSTRKKLTNREVNYIRRIFGDKADEIIAARNQDPEITYKAEYNFILDSLLYSIIATAGNNMEVLCRDITMVTGNRFLAEDVCNNVKEVVDKTSCFLKNFENLVCEGIDTYDENIGFKELVSIKK